MKFEHASVYNFENVVRAVRHPLESYDKSDSYWNEDSKFVIGEKDLKLMKNLINAAVHDKSDACRSVMGPGDKCQFGDS